MRGSMNAVRIVLLVLFSHFAGMIAFGQTGRGQLVGQVTDSTGGAVTNVELRAVDKNTGFVYSSSTNAEGIFRIINVNPGTYEIIVEAQGFKKLTRSGILVRSTETARVDAALEVGAVVESVEVKAEAPLLEIETSTPGHLVTGET